MTHILIAITIVAWPDSASSHNVVRVCAIVTLAIAALVLFLSAASSRQP